MWIILSSKNVGSQAARNVEVVGWELIDEVGLCFLWPSVLSLGLWVLSLG